MLSTEKIGNANQAKHYFLEQDNYYTQEQDAKEKSAWWGKGANTLGLEGEIDAQVFLELLKGKLPHGQQLGIIQDGTIKHRPGYDLTFSVPKSVSLLALLGEDSRIFDAVHQAVNKTLEQIEQNGAQARVTRQAVTSHELTQNLVVAKFLHDLSREGDPQLHVHCVVMNMTKRSDGQWRALASQAGDYSSGVTQEVNGFLERVRHHKHHYGLLFRAELAHELKQLGYLLVKTDNGFFEVEGISKELLTAYSNRRKQVETYMLEHGFSGSKAAAVATLKTRKPKNINRETLNALWQARGEQHHVDAFHETKKVVERALTLEKPLPPHSCDLSAAKIALQAAMHQLSETQVAISQIQLINCALQYTLDEGINTNSLRQAITELQTSGEFIALEEKHPTQGICFTTKQLIHYEQQILKAITEKHPSHQPLLPEPKINAYLRAQTDLDRQQHQAIKTLFSSYHQILAVEGPSGSGKTSLLKPLLELTRLGGYQGIVLTPDKVSQINTKQVIQPPPESLLEWISQHFDSTRCYTVPYFLKTQEKWLALGQKNTLSKAVIFVDQATALSSKQMVGLINLVGQTGARLIALGDANSLLPWQSGAPFLQMLQHRVTCARLTQNHRHQPESLKIALSASGQNEMQTAFEKINHNIVSIESKEERLGRIADHFASLSPDQRKKACVVMPTRQGCEEVNLLIHQKLKETSFANKPSLETAVLLPKYFNENQYPIAKHYAEGQTLRFNAACKSLGIKRGEYYEVKSIRSFSNRLLLENSKKKQIVWNPSEFKTLTDHVEVFEKKSREITVGETLICQRTDQQKALYKGEKLTVKEMSHHQMRLVRENGKLIDWNLKQPPGHHFDYGYAATPYKNHATTYDTIITYQNSLSRQSHRRLFYKTISLASKQVWIYTENRQQLLNNLQQQAGDKETAISVLLGKESIPHLLSEQNALLEKAFSKALNLIQKTGNVEKNSSEVAQEAVSFAIAHLSEREAAFAHLDVLKVAIEHVLGHVAPQEVEQAVLEVEKKGEIIRGLYSQNGIHWTTKDALATEKNIIELVTQSQGKLEQIASIEAIEEHLQATPPKAQHAFAIREIASSKDQVLLMQGYAGTGKTTLVKHVDLLLNHQGLFNQVGYELLCLAPTHTAVKELTERGLVAQTLDSYLADCRSRSTYDTPLTQYHFRQIIVVDESSMVSNQRLSDFLSYTKATQTRVLLMGDQQQYSAIEAGKPFALLQKSGLKVIKLTNIERQQDETLKQAVGEVYQGQYKEAFQTLNPHIIEIGQERIGDQAVDNRSKRLAAMADDYLSRPPDMRAKTLLITLGNDDRFELNALIRQRLQKEGELSGRKIITTILVPKNMTASEQRHVQYYQVNDILRFNYADRQCGIEKNEYLKLFAIEQTTLILKKENGQQVIWSPATLNDTRKVEVYRSQEHELQVGDRLRWTRSDKTLGLLSPELAKVECIDSNQYQIRPLRMTSKGLVSEGALMTIYPQDKRFQHWDYAYAMTGYSAQGKTIHSVILNVESYRKNLASQPSFLVGLTRAVHHVTLYTDDKKALLTRILKNTAEKTSALEVVGSLNTAAAAKNQDLSRLPHPAFVASPSFSYHAEEILQKLNGNLEAILKNLLGEPKEHHRQYYRYGSNKGSLVVSLQGDKRGLWHDFQTGEGGNLLHLIGQERGLDRNLEFNQILIEAVKLLGVSQDLLKVQSNKTGVGKAVASTPSVKETTAQKTSLRYARQLARESRPLAGTLGERYLREHRGISLNKWPASFRFHPAIYSQVNDAIKPALLVIAKDAKNTIQAVQAIFLDEQSAAKAKVKVQKQTWGVLSPGVCVNIGFNKEKGGILCVAEGPETGLSIFQAMSNAKVKVMLSCSNFKNIDLKVLQSTIVFCLDNDGKNTKSDRLIKSVAQKLLLENKEVWIAKPEMAGKDFNDLLREQGAGAVKDRIEHAVPYADYRDEKVPTKRLKTQNFNRLFEGSESMRGAIIEQAAHVSRSKKISAEIINQFIHSDSLASQLIKEGAFSFTTRREALTEKDLSQSLTTVSLDTSPASKEIQKMPVQDKVKDNELEL